MKIMVYLCLIGFFSSCIEASNENSNHKKKDFVVKRSMEFLGRRCQGFYLKLSTGNLEKAVSHDQELYDALKRTRNFKGIRDFEEVQSKLSRDSLLISKNATEDLLLQRFIVDKSEKCETDNYEKLLKKNKTLELTSMEITNCQIFEFCRKGYYVVQSDESGTYFIEEE